MGKKLWVNNAEAVIVIVIMLLLLGTLNIFSASFVKAGIENNNTYFFFERHVIFSLIGLVCMFVIGRTDYHRWRRMVMLLVIGTLIALVGVKLFGVNVNGARRWINIGVQFQPSELAKLATIMATAVFLGPRIDRDLKVTLVNPQMIWAIVMTGLIWSQPDMGTAAIVIAEVLIMYMLAGIAPRERRWLGLIAVVAVVGGICIQPYRLERVAAWWDPWQYSKTQGYQTVQSILSIGSGGFLGEGFGMGTSKFLYLPEAHTDFAFAVLAQEMGFVGVFVVILLMTALAIYGGKIANESKDGCGKLLVIGAIMLVVGQGVSNMAMVIGLLPVIGVPLPFISYGGTSLIVNLAAIGMILSVDRMNRLAVKRAGGGGPNGGERVQQRDSVSEFEQERRGA